MAKKYTHRYEYGKMIINLGAPFSVTYSNEFIVHGIKVVNNSTTEGKANIQFSPTANSTDGIAFLPYVTPIPAGDVLIFDNQNIPLPQYTSIWMKAESTNFTYHFWGVNEYTST